MTIPRTEVVILMQGIRQAFRVWRRVPVLTAAVLLTLAIGIGANTAVFSVVYAVVLRPMPYPDADRLVELFEHNRVTSSLMRVSGPNYLSWAGRSRSFEALAAFNGADFNLGDDGNPERISGIAATPSLFRVLGVGPVLGRPLTAEDAQTAAPRIALISESLWQRRFAEDPAVIGRFISLSGTQHQIVGVVPSTFRGIGRAQASTPAIPDVVVPMAINPAIDRRSNHVLRVVGRLAPSVALEQARDEMSTIARAMEQDYAASNAGWGIRIDRVHDSMFESGVQSSMLTLLGAVGLVLLIACANVANLMLARTSGRQRELAMRTVLGAERGRVIRQLLTESLCVALFGGLCGLAVAYVAIELMRGWLPPTLPRIDEVRLDMAVLAFGLLISAASGVLVGMLPALRVTRDGPLQVLSGTRGVANRSRAGVRQALLVAQMGLATVLLIAAGLLLQSFVRLQNVAVGFDATGVMTARIGLPRMTADRALARYEELMRSIERLPGVEAAAIATSAPFAAGVRRGLTVRNTPGQLPEDGVSAVEHIVSSDYFRALRIPVIAGASFSGIHSPTSPPVAIVSQSLARQLWGGNNAVGRELERDGRAHRVVGVVGDIKGADGSGPRGGGRDREPARAVYLSAAQFPQTTMTLVVRTGNNAEGLVASMRTALLAVDPTVPLYQVRSLSDFLAEANASTQVTTTLTSVFAILALFLAAIGVYGVVSYAVEQRTEEMSVRIAIGATPAQVVLLMVRAGMLWSVVGIAIGLLAASWLGQLLASLLFEVREGDPATFMSVALILAVVALSACYLPARRAARVDALATLRSG